MDRARDILLGLTAARPDLQEWSGDLAMACWEDAVGDLLARVSRPAAFAGRLLIVEVDSAQWVSELEEHSEAIRRRINKLVGRNVVGRLVYRLRRAEPKPPGQSETAVAQPVDPMRRRIFQDGRSRR